MSTDTINSLHQSSLAVAVIITNSHFANPQNDDQAEFELFLNIKGGNKNSVNQ